MPWGQQCGHHDAAQPQSAGTSVVINDAAQPQSVGSSVVLKDAAQPQYAGPFQKNLMPWRYQCGYQGCRTTSIRWSFPVKFDALEVSVWLSCRTTSIRWSFPEKFDALEVSVWLSMMPHNLNPLAAVWFSRMPHNLNPLVFSRKI